MAFGCRLPLSRQTVELDSIGSLFPRWLASSLFSPPLTWTRAHLSQVTQRLCARRPLQGYYRPRGRRGWVIALPLIFQGCGGHHGLSFTLPSKRPPPRNLPTKIGALSIFFQNRRASFLLAAATFPPKLAVGLDTACKYSQGLWFLSVSPLANTAECAEKVFSRSFGARNTEELGVYPCNFLIFCKLS